MAVPNYYTGFDLVNAGTYASNRIKMLRCQDSDIQKQIPGIGWVRDSKLQNISCPIGLDDCQESFGRCKFLTKDSCLAQSGDFKKQGMGEKPYLEWHPELEGAKTGSGENIGKCVFGNFALRNWCENPQSRRAGQFVAGVTNVPPFNYNQTTGICEMTKPYCDYMGVGYTDRNDDYYKETGIDVPDCHESDVQKFIEKYVTGKVLFRGFKRGLFTKFLADVGESLLKPGPLTYYDFIKGVSDGQYKEDLGMNQNYNDIYQPDDNSQNSKRFANGSKNIKENIKENFKTQNESEDKNQKVENILNDITSFEKNESEKNTKTKKENIQTRTKSEDKNQKVENILNDIITSFKKNESGKNTKTKKENIQNNNFPEIFITCDPKAMDNKILVGPDFGGPGINLYYIQWNLEYLKNHSNSKPSQYGFICDELSKAGFNIIKNNGYKTVKLTKENTNKTHKTRRIYMIYLNPDWTFSFLSNLLIDTKLFEYLLKNIKK